MVELGNRHIQHHPSVLHALDSRLKLAGMAVLSLAVLNGRLALLGGFIPVLLFLVWRTGRLHRPSGKKWLPAIVLLALVFAVRAVVTPGVPVVEMGFLSISMAGLHDGALVAGRLLAILLLGWLVMFTTRSTDIRAAVQWFFTPVPFIPEKRVATMMGLIMRFIPLIFNQVQATNEARQARGIANRRHPIARMATLVLPVMRRTFQTADHLALAMTARCYSENRTLLMPSFKRMDGIAATVIVLLCVAILFF